MASEGREETTRTSRAAVAMRMDHHPGVRSQKISISTVGLGWRVEDLQRNEFLVSQDAVPPFFELLE